MCVSIIVPPSEHEGSSALSGLLASPNSPAPNAEAPRAPIQFRRVMLLFFIDSSILSRTFITGSVLVQCVFEILETILRCFQLACPLSENVFEGELHLPHISIG